MSVSDTWIVAQQIGQVAGVCATIGGAIYGFIRVYRYFTNFTTRTNEKMTKIADDLMVTLNKNLEKNTDETCQVRDRVKDINEAIARMDGKIDRNVERLDNLGTVVTGVTDKILSIKEDLEETKQNLDQHIEWSEKKVAWIVDNYQVNYTVKSGVRETDGRKRRYRNKRKNRRT